MKSRPLRTANPSPLEWGSVSLVMSLPHARYPFSRRSESIARYPPGTRPWGCPAVISVSQSRAVYSADGYSSQPSSPT